jgi:plasmid stabilization system protein ParE
VKLVWRSSAHADVVRLVEHILLENPIAARRVARALLLAGDSLADFPRRGRPGRVTGTRELVAVWPYVIVYEIDGDTVHVLRVWHGAAQRETD